MITSSPPPVAAVDIKVGGRQLDPATVDNLIEVRVDLQSRLPDRCVLVFADPKLDFADGGTFTLGGELEVALAAPRAAVASTVFAGRVSSLEPHFDRTRATLAVHAYDRAHALTRTRRTDTFQQVAYADVARRVAGRNGLSAGTIGSGGGTVRFVQQSNETDWELLWRLADEIGYEVKVRGRELDFRPAGPAAGATPVTLTWGEGLLEFHPRVTGVQQVESVEVRGWDPLTKQAIVASATPAAAGTDIGIARDTASSSLGGGTVVVADRPVQTDVQASALAAAVAGQIGDAFAEADGVTIGDPRLRPGGKVTIEGVGTRFGGTYALASVTHAVRSRDGFETRFGISARTSRSMLDLTGSRPGDPWTHTVVVGIVTNNSDPDKLGRVRVRHPVLGDQHEGWWARVLAPAAGTNRGLLMLPQPGDEVLVAFEHDDTEHPYVLGSVWNGQAKPGALEHPDGSFAVRSDKQIAMEAAAAIAVQGDKELKLSSAGHATITTTERRGDGPPGNVTVDAKGAAKVQSGAALTLSAGSDAKLSGASKVEVDSGTSKISVTGSEISIQAGALKLSSTGAVQISGRSIVLG